jgi:hypothetical protein
MAVLLYAAGRREPLGEAHVPSLKSDEAQVTVPAASLPPGTYVLVASLSGREGVLGTGRFVFAVFPHFLDRDADGR